MLTQLKQLLHIHTKKLIYIACVLWWVMLLYLIIRVMVVNTNLELTRQIKPIAWSDISIESSTPFPDDVQEYIWNLWNTYDITAIQTVSFSTNIVSDTLWPQLISVQWVESAYPLYGELDIEELGTTWDDIDPKQISIYIDELTYRDATVDNEIKIGTQTFPVTGAIKTLPWASVSFFDSWRTILMPYDLVEDTGLTQIGSRTSYTYQIRANDQSQLESLTTQVKNAEILAGRFQISDINQRLGQVSSITDQFNSFVTYVIVIAAIIASVSIYILLTTFFLTERRYIGIRGLLGSPTKTLGMIYTSIFWLAVIWWWTMALILVYIWLQVVTWFELTADFFLPGWVVLESLWVALILGIISLSMPLYTTLSQQLLQLLRVQDLVSSRTIYIQGLLTMIGIWAIYRISTRDMMGAVYTVVWLMLIAVIYTLITKWFLISCRHIVQKFRWSRFAWFDGVRSTLTPGNQTTLISWGIVLAISSLILIGGSSMSFVQQLNTLRNNPESLIVLNVLPEDLPYIQENYTEPKLYDIILSRIQTVKWLPLQEYLNQRRSEREVSWNWWSQWWRWDSFGREYNTTTIALPASDYISWSPPQEWEVSFAQDFADRLGVDIWDRIVFYIQWREFDLEITSLRSINQDWSWPFFYMQYNAEQFATAPKTYFWFADVDEEQKAAFKATMLDELWPHLSFVDTSEIIQTVADVSSKILTVIYILTACIVLLVITSIYIALHSMLRLKQTKITLYRLIGGTRDFIARSLRSELIVVSGRGLLVAWFLGIWALYMAIQASPLLQWSIYIWVMIGLVIVVTFVSIVWYGMGLYKRD